MESGGSQGTILVTGAGGQVGAELCRTLRAAGRSVLAVDVLAAATSPVAVCDLTRQEQIAALFRGHSFRAIVHLAAILPTAFLADPWRGVEVNLTASCRLLRAAVEHRVKRFVFASSMSVYGSSAGSRPRNEDDPVAPDDPYGACKCAVESVGRALAVKQALEFVALRIARVVGPGATSTSSVWRSQMFEPAPSPAPVSIPFAPETILSLVHVQDVARMLMILAEAGELRRAIYNAPAEILQAQRLREMIQAATGAPVELVPAASAAGSVCDGSRFARDFGYQIRKLAEYLAVAKATAPGMASTSFHLP